MSIYVDANVLISTFVEDEFSKKAERFFEAGTRGLHISDFVRAEFASVMGRLFRMKRLNLAEAREILAVFDIWASQKFEPVETQTADVRTAESLLRDLTLGLRAPDAINIAIAQRLGAELATFDKKMATAASKLGVTVADI